jgi:hypothetical protein
VTAARHVPGLLLPRARSSRRARSSTRASQLLLPPLSTPPSRSSSRPPRPNVRGCYALQTAQNTRSVLRSAEATFRGLFDEAPVDVPGARSAGMAKVRRAGCSPPHTVTDYHCNHLSQSFESPEVQYSGTVAYSRPHVVTSTLMNHDQHVHGCAGFRVQALLP